MLGPPEMMDGAGVKEALECCGGTYSGARGFKASSSTATARVSAHALELDLCAHTSNCCTPLVLTASQKQFESLKLKREGFIRARQHTCAGSVGGCS